MNPIEYVLRFQYQSIYKIATPHNTFLTRINIMV